MASSKVSIARTSQNPDYEQIQVAVEKAIDLLGGIGQIVKPGQKVLLNPSLVNARTRRDQATITLPEVTRAVADMVKKAKARPIIAESSAIGIDTEKVISESGYQQLREMGYEVIDLKKSKTITLPVKNGHIFSEIQAAYISYIIPSDW